MNANPDPVWLVAGLRTPFARVDGDFKGLDAIALSVSLVRAMAMGAGKRAIVSICADGGLGTVALLGS